MRRAGLSRGEAGRMVREQRAYMLSELFSVNAYKIIPDAI
jgi:hypothetical protein